MWLTQLSSFIGESDLNIFLLTKPLFVQIYVENYLSNIFTVNVIFAIILYQTANMENEQEILCTFLLRLRFSSLLASCSSSSFFSIFRREGKRKV